MNNAGCMVSEREMTEDGLEKNFATNTLGQLLHHTHTHDGSVACCCRDVSADNRTHSSA